MHQSSKIHIIVGIVLIFLFFLVYWVVQDYPVSPVGVSPATFPRMAAGIIGVLGVLLIVTEFFTKTKTSDTYFARFGKEQWVILLVIGFTIAYIAFVKRAGFILTTIIYLFALLKIFGEKKHVVALGFSIFLSFVLFFIMRRVFGVPLPLGIFERLFLGY